MAHPAQHGRRRERRRPGARPLRPLDGARGATLFAKVVLPAAAPSVFTGVRLGAAYAFMVLVAAEMIGVNDLLKLAERRATAWREVAGA